MEAAGGTEFQNKQSIYFIIIKSEITKSKVKVQQSQGIKHRITQRIGLGNWRQVGNRTKLSLTQELVVLIS